MCDDNSLPSGNGKGGMLLGIKTYINFFDRCVRSKRGSARLYFEGNEPLSGKLSHITTEMQWRQIAVERLQNMLYFVATIQSGVELFE